MEFVKISFPDGDLQWRLILQSDDDVRKYHGYDVEVSMTEYLYGDKTIKNSKADVINTILEVGKGSLKEGEKGYPLFMISEHLDKKALGMLKAVKKGKLCVNEAGGYCFLDGFLSQHKAKVIQTIHKRGFGLPNESEPVASDIIILENSNTVDPNFIKELKQKDVIIDSMSVLEITNLKSQDLTHVFKSMILTKVIATETQALDLDQVGDFIEMFSKLESKKVYIKIDDPLKIKEHTNFDKLNKHQINFI